ncbi:hypothetical protein HKBW3S42_01649 [Candidatus Hakubella thermalkaliphila]|uniref:HNH nuclease domain-containing protein n=1 Tax=Candidatus Hakubella thermalkaliphila TaxID=2754717 RepID=A0A6V8PKV8_9ACTN|nr:hypothetical protein HKBW3S42_01649 [Candidatus Hakubella thermalkaliphila]
MAIHREPNESEKRIINEQHTREGKVRCFVNDHPIDNESEIDYHHIKPFSQRGLTEIPNLAPVCREHHKRIGTLSIIEFRARLKLEDFFNNPEPRRLDDILEIKLGSDQYGKTLKTKISSTGDKIKIIFDETGDPLELPLSTCLSTGHCFFYVILPIKYVKNDFDLQP